VEQGEPAWQAMAGENDADIPELDLDDDEAFASGAEEVQPSEDAGVLPLLPGWDAPAADVSGLETETMAELYLRQGFTHRAMAVYQALLRRRPDDERLATRLRELQAMPVPPAAEESGEADDPAAEDWLQTAGMSWLEPAGSVADDPTPYTWFADPPEVESAAGPGITEYLQQLVSWRGAPAGEVDAEIEAAEEDAEIGAAEVDAEIEAAEVMPWQQEWDAAASHDAEVERSADALADDAAGQAQAGEPPEAAEQSQAGQQAQAGPSMHGRSTEDPVEAAFNEWYGVSEPEVEVRVEDDTGDDDEDLAMFRSWLQSLKK
jgi:hypothetical protein